MKKIVCMAVMMTGFMSFAGAQVAKPDFRSFNWGSSFEQVHDNETATFISKDNDDMLAYKDDLGGYDCDVIYSFNENDKLIGGSYVFTKKYTNPQLYIQDYNSFKGLLMQKYGTPANEKEHWTINSPRPGKHNYGQAIAEGNLSLVSEWITDRSIIQIELNSSNKQPLLHIHYTTKSLDELEDKEALQKALPKL